MSKSEWGEYAYWVKVEKNPGDYRHPHVSVKSEKIKKVGRKYVTLDNPHENRIDMETHWEVKDWGDKRCFFPTLAEAEEAACRKRLMSPVGVLLTYEGRLKAEKLSVEELETLCFLLTGEKKEGELHHEHSENQTV